jgi:hypothetical protein
MVEVFEALLSRAVMREISSLSELIVKTGWLDGIFGSGVFPSSAQSRGIRVWLLSGSSIT